jgi:hypothetical protein
MFYTAVLLQTSWRNLSGWKKGFLLATAIICAYILNDCDLPDGD